MSRQPLCSMRVLLSLREREPARDFAPPQAEEWRTRFRSERVPLLAGRQARLIKRQAVPRVTDDVWGGAPVVTRSRIQLPDDLSADSYEVVEMRIIVTLHDALETFYVSNKCVSFFRKKRI